MATRQQSSITVQDKATTQRRVVQQGPTTTPRRLSEELGGIPSERYIRMLLQRGELPGVKMGRMWVINRHEALQKLGLEGERDA